MKALVLQHYYTSREITGVSMFMYWVNLARYNDWLYMTLSIPRPAWKDKFVSRSKWISWDLKNEDCERILKEIGLKNLRFVRLALSRTYYDAETIIPMNEDEWSYLLWKNLENTDYDVILNGRYGIGDWVKMLMFKRGSGYTSRFDLPVITFVTETYVDKRLPALAEKPFQLKLLSDMASVDMVWVFNEVDRRAMEDIAWKYLSPSLYKELKRKIEVVRPLIADDEFNGRVEEFMEERKKRLKNGRVHFFHSGAIEPKRRIGQYVVPILEKCRDRGSNVYLRLNVTSVHLLNEKWLQKDFIIVRHGLSRSEYLDTFGEGDVGLSLSEYEGTGIAYLEMARSGMLMIFWDEEWQSGRIPKGYPYVVDSPEELEEVINMLSDPNEVLKAMDEWGWKLAEFTSKRFGRSEGERTGKIIEKLVFDHAESMSDHMILLFDVLNELNESLPDVIDEEQLYGVIASATRVNKSVNAVKKMLPRAMLKKAMLKLGYVDIGGFDEVKFRKVVR